MRAALCVNPVSGSVDSNLRAILAMMGEAASQGAELALFPEAALTGLINEDNPAHDLPLGQPVPGPVVDCLAERCRALNLWLGIGLLEQAGGLYDSAVLIDPGGLLRLHYRRINPGWHGSRADGAVYREGDRLGAVETPFGRALFLICGDLFDDELLDQACALHPDVVLFPFARSGCAVPAGLCSGSPGLDAWDEGRWQREEQDEYVARAARLGAWVLMVNSLAPPELAGGAFGGALVVTPRGEVTGRLPLGQPGMLVVENDWVSRWAIWDHNLEGFWDMPCLQGGASMPPATTRMPKEPNLERAI